MFVSERLSVIRHLGRFFDLPFGLSFCVHSMNELVRHPTHIRTRARLFHTSYQPKRPCTQISCVCVRIRIIFCKLKSYCLRKQLRFLNFFELSFFLHTLCSLFACFTLYKSFRCFSLVSTLLQLFFFFFNLSLLFLFFMPLLFPHHLPISDDLIRSIIGDLET